MAEIRAEAEHALASGWAGDFRVADVLLPRLDALGARQPDAAAWAIALRAQRWHAEAPQGVLPALAAIEKLVGKGKVAVDPGVRVAVAAACVQVEHAAVLLFDPAGLERWVSVHARVLEGLPRDQS